MDQETHRILKLQDAMVQFLFANEGRGRGRLGGGDELGMGMGMPSVELGPFDQQLGVTRGGLALVQSGDRRPCTYTLQTLRQGSPPGKPLAMTNPDVAGAKTRARLGTISPCTMPN